MGSQPPVNKPSAMAAAMQDRPSAPRLHRGDSVSAAQPISMSATSNQNKPRSDSLASSVMTGMSWGQQSVGSWLRDEITMQGTSPFAYPSPSFNSSSYQPKLEANYMRNFSCCNQTLEDLHKLLEHYETCHPKLAEAQRASLPRPDPKAAIASNAAAALKDPTQAQSEHTKKAIAPQRSDTPVQRTTIQPAAPSFPATGHDDETMGDMEMDDISAPQQFMPQPMMNGFRPQAPPLDMSAANGSNALLQHQGLRTSTPTTPNGRGGVYYGNNPTVSSVNTPSLTTGPAVHALQQQQQFFTPDSSAPGTPGELDPDMLSNMSQMNMSYLPQSQNAMDASLWGFPATNNGLLDDCVTDPAKTLFQANGGVYNPPQGSSQAQNQSAQQLGDGQYSENSEMARNIREQQRLAGVPDPSADGVPKPFHCPVIGCEKAYKNQNGLKYHKSHGHNTQTLHNNNDGTFSIVDPETLQPYPGTKGMEKHKPYQCQSCGKRYKNLNGLKYHKSHTNVCDPEIKGLPSGANSPTAEGSASKRASLVGTPVATTPAATTSFSEAGMDVN